MRSKLATQASNFCSQVSPLFADQAMPASPSVSIQSRVTAQTSVATPSATRGPGSPSASNLPSAAGVASKGPAIPVSSYAS